MLTRIDPRNAEKLLTKSVFEQGIHVSEACLDLFVNPLERGKNKPLSLWHDRSEPYNARILYSKTGQRQLIHIVWYKEFRTMLQNLYSSYYQQIKDGLDPETKLYMRFNRRNDIDSYDISFSEIEASKIKELKREAAKEYAEGLSQLGGIPPAVRILPMSLVEFKDEGCYTVKDVQKKYFLDDLPFKQYGCYHYKTRGLRAPRGTVVLFQCESNIIASAVLERSEVFEQPYEGRYKGGLYFDVSSIRVFSPIDADEIKRIWPTFKSFGNVPQQLDVNSYATFEQKLTGIEMPQMWLRAEEADLTYPRSENEVYVPQGDDRRLVVERQIRERRGQGVFRDNLRKRYGDRCLVTGCKVLAVLEAAHISPYLGEADNHPENGLLLRADIHTLFDLDLLGIEPEALRVELHPDVSKEYGQFAGKTLACVKVDRPSTKALQQRYELFKKRMKVYGD